MIYFAAHTVEFDFNNIKTHVNVGKLLINYIEMCGFYEFSLLKNIN